MGCEPACATVSVPGPPGVDGTNGTNGQNAFTITTASFIIPAIGGSVSVAVANSAWAAIGQNVFVTDGVSVGNFQVTAEPDNNTFTLKFLGYTGDTAPTAVMGAGAMVSPSGLEGPSGTTVLATIDSAVGGSQALTTSPNTQVLGKSLTLAASAGKKYMLFARCRFDYVGAQFAANQTINFKLRCTNNTIADVAGAVGNLELEVIAYPTVESFSVGEITIIAIPYTTSGVSDVIQPMASIGVLPGAGSVQAVECSISAAGLT